MAANLFSARALKTMQHLNRVPEILRCQRHTSDWLKLTKAYVGVAADLPFDVNLPSGKFRFCEVSDVATFWQIFYRQIYRVERSDRLIVDAGANIGAFTLYALQTAPQANVISIEPAPDSCDRVRSMLRAHNLESRCVLHQAALAASPGKTTLELNVGSQFRRSGTPGITVETVTLDSLIPQNEVVDMLKMDIEGAEYEVLNSVSIETLRRVRRVVLEYHPNAAYDLAIQPLIASGLNITGRRDDGDGYGMVWLGR